MRDRDEVTELALATTRGDRVALSEFIRKTQADVCFVSRLSRPSVGDGLTQQFLIGPFGAVERAAKLQHSRVVQQFVEGEPGLFQLD